MVIEFSKYHGAGNDFIIIDDRLNQFDANDERLISKMCDRRFGIGADGLMLVRNHAELDFEMVYFNSDGRTSSMCGNGGRCIVSFATQIGVVKKPTTQFMAIDGIHSAVAEGNDLISLQMNDVSHIELINDDEALLDTGSPHFIRFVPDIQKVDLITTARDIRYSDRFKTNGVNVNFVEVINDGLRIRTYERGVENETLACGTGVTAAAIAAHRLGKKSDHQIKVSAIGGELSVRFKENGLKYSDVWKTGPVAFVYSGNYQVS